MTHLLDTSALLAFFLRETGADRVQMIFDDDRNAIVVSALTKVEFWSRLKSLGREADFEREWSLHLPLFHAVLGVDDRIAGQSICLRRATAQRLPTIDALIAATAAVHGLMLVHRDPHFQPIAGHLLKQIDLAEAS